METSILIHKKKGQAWSIDLVVASVVFIIAVIILYVYAVNYTSQSRDKLEELFYEGNLASELILSEDDFGIISNSQINLTKLAEYSNYQSKKDDMGLRRNFYFSIQGNPTSYGLTNSSPVENLIQITRITISNNKLIKFQLYVWE